MTPPSDCVPLLRSARQYNFAEWLEKRPVRHGWKGRTCRDAWAFAPSPDWLIHYARQAGADGTAMSRAASACVRMAIGHAHPGQERDEASRMIEATEQFFERPNFYTDTRYNEVRSGMAYMVNSSLVHAAIRARHTPWISISEAMASVRLDAGHAGLELFKADCSDAIRRLVPFVDLARAGVPVP